MPNNYWKTTDWAFVGKFDNGALEMDSSGHGNHLTNVGVTYLNGAKFVRAEGDYLYRPHASLASGFPGTTGYTDLAVYAEFTLASLPSVSDHNTLAFKGGGAYSWRITLYNSAGNQKVYFAVHDGTDWRYSLIYDGALELSTPYALGVSYDHVAQTILFKMVRLSDSVAISDSTSAFAYQMQATSGDFFIGSRGSSGLQCFDGTIHELAISNTPKTEADFDAMAAGVYNDVPEATYKVYVDWDNDGDYEDSNEDISDYCLNPPKWEHGRARDTDYDQAGTMSVELKNESAIFSPLNTASPLYGSVKPNRRVKVTMTYAGATTTKFVGFLEALLVEGSRGANTSTAILSAIGTLGQFDESDFDLATQQTIKTGEVITALLDSDSWPSGDRIVEDGLTTLSEYWVDKGTTRITAMRGMQDMEFGRLRESLDGKVVFDARDHIYNSPHDTPQAYYGDGYSLGIWDLQQLDARPGIFNSVRAMCKPYNFTDELALVTIADITRGIGGAPPYVAGSSTIYLYAEVDLSQFSSVASWTSTSHTANAAADGSGSDLTSDISISLTPLGARAQLQITNSSATAAYLTRLIVYGIAWAQGDTIEIRAEDSTSRAAYGRREYQHIGNWHTSTRYTQQHADYAVTRFKDPRAQIRFKVFANQDATHMADVVAREIGDRIHVKAPIATGVYLDADFVIDRITHVVRSKRDHFMVITCTQAPTAELAATGEAYSPQIIPYSKDVNPSSDYEPVGADTAQPGAISSLTLNVGEGMMWFTFARPVTNYKGVTHVCISIGTGSTHHGPYAAQLTAYPADVLDSDSGLSVQAGQLTFAIASGTPGAYAGKVLLIRKTGDTGLDGHVIASDSGTSITLSSAFFSSGVFSWQVVEPYYTLNTKDYVFEVPGALDNFDVEDATWRTKKIPIEVGTWYARGYALNKYGCSTSIATSSQTAVAHVRTGATHRTSSGAARVQMDPTNGIRTITSGGVTRGQLAADGSAYIQSAASGARTRVGTSGIEAYSTDGQTVSIDTSGGYAIYSSPTGARIEHSSTYGTRGLDSSANVLSLIDKSTGKTTNKSATSGARMEYDQTNGIRVYDSSGNLVSQWGPSTGISLGTAYRGARVTFDPTNGIRGINSSGVVESQLIASSGLLKIKQIYSLDQTCKIDLRTENTLFLDTNTSTYAALKVYESSGDLYLASVAGSNRGSTPGNIILQGGRVGSTYNKIKIVPSWAGTTIHVQVDENGTEIDGPFTAKDGVNVDSGSVYKVNGTQVVGAQGDAVADATDASTTMARLNDLLARCRAHGLIAT